MFLSCLSPRSTNSASAVDALVDRHLRKGKFHRVGNAFEPRRDIDPVAHEIARLVHDIAHMDADPEFDAPLGRGRVALDHAVLHPDGAADGVHDAAELDKAPVAGALHDAAVMDGDSRIDEIAREGPQPRQRAILVSAGEAAAADNIRDQYRRKFPSFGHDAPSATNQTSAKDRSELREILYVNLMSVSGSCGKCPELPSISGFYDVAATTL